MRSNLAQIIAARETVDARRGGAHLDRRLDPEKYAQRAADVEDYLLNMTGDAARDLARQAQEGHGGAMLESYRRQNTYAFQAEAIKEDFGLNQRHMDVARAMALLIHGEEAPNQPVNEALVANTAEQIRTQPGYRAFSRNPATVALLQEGNPTRLGASLEECNYQAADLAEDMGEDIKSGPDEFKEKGKEQPKERGPFEV